MRPFRDVLLGLFFIGIGMRFDPVAIVPIWQWALLGALLLLASKTLIVAVTVRRMGVEPQVAWRTGLLLSVGGEFGLALVAIALDARVFDEQLGQIAITSVLISMVLGALLIRFNGVIAARLAADSGSGVPPPAGLPDSAAPQVIIGGYGRVGHTVAVLLEASGVPYIAFDTDPKRLAQGRADGHAVAYGDISDPELLAAIHVERAALLVITVDRPEAALKAIDYLRRACPLVPVIARARDLESSSRLLQAGAVHAYPETIEASLRLGAAALHILRKPAPEIDEVLQGVRDMGYLPVLEANEKR